MTVVRPAITVAAKFIAHNAGATPIPNLNIFEQNTVVRPDATAALKPVTTPVSELPLLDVDFCGECLPLDQIDVVDRWKHVFTLFRTHASDLGNLRQRADAFFPMIDPILAKYDIPDDFRYVPLAESALRPKAVSGREPLVTGSSCPAPRANWALK